MHLELDKKLFCLEGAVTGRAIALIRGILTLRDVAINVCLSKVRGRVNRKLGLKGSFNIGRLTVRATIQATSTRTFASAAVTKGLGVQALMSTFKTGLVSRGSSVDGTVKADAFSAYHLTQAFLEILQVKASGGKSTSVYATGRLPAISASFKILFMGLGSPARGAAVLLKLPRLRLSRAVSMISNVDIRPIPVLAKLEVPSMQVLIANLGSSRLPSGYNIHISDLRKLPMAHGCIIKPDLRFAGREFILEFNKRGFGISFNSPPTLDQILRALVPQVGNLNFYKSLSSIVPGVFRTRLQSVDYDWRGRKLTVRAILRSTRINHGLLTVRSATLTTELVASSGNNQARLSASLEGIVILRGLALKITLAYNHREKRFTLKLTSPSGHIRLGQVFSTFGSAFPRNFNQAVQRLHLHDVQIRTPLFEIQRHKGRVFFRVRGTPVFRGFSAFSLEILASTHPRHVLLILNAPRFSMGKLIGRLSGLALGKVPFLSMLNGPSSVGVTFSSSRINPIPFPIKSYPVNQLTTIERGLGFVVAFRLPTKCGDKICTFFQKILGKRVLLFHVSGISGPEVTVGARFPISFTIGRFRLYNIFFGFTLSSSKPPAIGLTSISMDLKVSRTRKLLFRGRLLIDAVFNIVARLRMIGIYERAFGIPWLAFGNIDAGFRGRIDCPPCITQLRLGGELALGQRCYRGNGHNCIKARGYMNIDGLDPKQNFYYFKLNQLSLRKLLGSVGIHNIPGIVLVDRVHVRNVEASYSLVHRTIPLGLVPGVTKIRAGIVMKGVINVLFLVNVRVDIQVVYVLGVTRAVRALIHVSPIQIGPLRFCAVRNHHAGPRAHLKAEVLPRPHLFFELDGLLQIQWLKYSRGIKARFTDKGLRLQLSGPIYNIEARFTLTAQFRNVRHPTSMHNFVISGRFATLGSFIVQNVKGVLEHVSRPLKSKLDAAQRRLADADRKVARAAHVFNLKRHLRDKRRNAFNHARNRLNSAQHAVNRLCSLKNCRSCRRVPKPCIKRSCSWGICIPRPGFCGTHCVPFINPVCTAQNVGCQVIRKAAFAAFHTARLALSAAERALKAAEHATSVASHAVGNARILSNTARVAFKGVNGVFHALRQAINVINSAFRIHSVNFHANISSVRHGHIGVELDMTVFGRRQRLRLTLNMRDIRGFASHLARRFYRRFF